jgi:flagellar hook-associated protein 1 FlgK
MSAFAAGNVVTLDYQDAGTSPPGPARRILLVPTKAGLPVTQPSPALSDPGALVIEADVAGGLPAALATLAAKLTDPLNGAVAGRFAVTATAPALRIVANPGTAVVAGGITATGLSGSPVQSQLPLFVDAGRGNAPYTGATLGSTQLLGFAQRIALNPAVLADRSKLVVSGPGVPQGDMARPQFLLDALTGTTLSFAAAAGIGGGGAPYVASVADFSRRIVEAQGANAEMAERLDEGQQVALAAVQSRFDSGSAVNVDQEMAQLVALQTAYGANARIMTAVRDMLDMLLRI